MNKPVRYPEVLVNGLPRELGKQIGDAAGEQVRGFCEVAMKHVQRTTSISRDKALEVARQSAAFADAYSPDMVEELRGTAEAAGVSFDDLMLLQVRNQLQPDSNEGCTALSLPIDSSVRSGSLVAQNWDADPALDEFTIVLTRRPAGKPALTTCTQAGLISYMGFNEVGIGACVNTLPAPVRGVGVPHYFTLRGIYEALTLDKAVESVSRAHRAIPANILLATNEGPADLEVTVDSVHTLRPHERPWLTHTNHCIHPDLTPTNEQFPELIQSHARKQRIDQLLDSSNATTIDDVKEFLRDHDGYPKSICRHANDDPHHGFWETVFSIIIEAGEGRMHISRGTPCNHTYETYEML
jgi:isopenicillin-N N-acyltransferase-like protein